jgi:hypothetical protein
MVKKNCLRLTPSNSFFYKIILVVKKNVDKIMYNSLIISSLRNYPLSIIHYQLPKFIQIQKP